VAGLAAILAWEHAIVRPGDLSRIDRAFFDLNARASVAYLACTLTDVYVWPG
jgi:4-hydroxybenzoate polyprenyltransferase